MNGQDDIHRRISLIRSTFQEGQTAVSKIDDLNQLYVFLDSFPPEFRSVAWEGASMELALSDFSKGDNLHDWLPFRDGPGKIHSTQIHIGLGWALAQEKRAPFSFMETTDPLTAFRILDGMGYYDGVFRRKETLRNPKGPEHIPGKYRQGYDMGLGRSLWYNCMGDAARIPELVSQFSSVRHSDLWRGIGVACTYVGGFNEDALSDLTTLAAEYQIKLASGAALVARARLQAGSLTSYTELACQIWCGCNAEEAKTLTVKSELSVASNPEEVFSSWISNIESKLRERSMR
jgi:hypothetical protein